MGEKNPANNNRRPPGNEPFLKRTMLRHLGRRLREIVAPSSMPDPPGMFPAADSKLPLREHLQVWGFALREYVNTWRADLADHEQGRGDGLGVDSGGLTDDLAGVARSSADGLKPYLQKIYKARAVAYRDAVTQFVLGYREGVSQAKENDLFAGEGSATVPGGTERDKA